jgi:hypothetical protein
MLRSAVTATPRQLGDEALYGERQARSTDTAAANVSSLTNGAPISGTTVTFSTTITPKAGPSQLAIMGSISGTDPGHAGDLVTVNLKINGVAVRQAIVEAGATTTAWAASLQAIDSNTGAGYPTGTAVTVAVTATATDSLTVAAAQALISVQEVPLK